MQQTLSILTYNIHKGFSSGNVRFQLPELKQSLDGLDADFVFLQEIVGAHKKREKRLDWPQEGQVAFLAKDRWCYTAYGKHADYKIGNHGNAILSKQAFGSMNNVTLSQLPRASRGFLHVTLCLFDQYPIHLICIHLGLSKRIRSSHIQTLGQYLEEQIPPKEALILAGDFNDWRRRDTEFLEKSAHLIEAFKWLNGAFAKTYPAFHPAFCTDRIYFRGLKLLSAQCLANQEWKSHSDHLPLLATFSPPF